ncbi:MAG: hydantoinase/oxoprolinase family protein, partial [Pseudomonadota bacterium]|nr:hydantoinase/oxoprolinase family protein [Pseudomonadota bacterium]
LDGQPLFTSERTVAGYPVKSPAIDVTAIGAGGGSIAWIDDGGALKVGPHSAGASPGPVAYGLGGKNITLTDANLILGRLNPNAPLAGNISLDVETAYIEMENQIADPLNISVEAAATGIIKVASSGIARAIRGVASAKGNSPSEFTLFAYGGAGPLCAADVNEEVGCPKIIIPPAPGTLCARGILLSDLSFDFVRSLLVFADKRAWETVINNFDALKEQARQFLINDGVILKARSFKYYLEARYKGQSYELRIQLPDRINSKYLAKFIDAFHMEHKKEFGYELLKRPIEIVNCRLEAVGKTSKPITEKPSQNKTRPTVRETRKVYFGSAFGWRDTPVYGRSCISYRAKIKGPAIIEEMSSTTILPPNYEAKTDNGANLILMEVP